MDDPGWFEAGMAAMDAALDRLPGPSLATSDAELRDQVLAWRALQAKIEAKALAWLAALDARPGAVPGARPGQVGATFLKHVARAGRAEAFRAVRAAAATAEDGVLPVLGAALAAGAVSRAHVDVAVRAVGRLPTRLLARVDTDGVPVAARVDAFITQQCRVLTPDELDRVLPQLLATIDPDGQDCFDAAADERRGFRTHRDPTGMIVGAFELDPEAGATLRAAIDRYAAPNPPRTAVAEDGAVVEVRDTRTRSQRDADGLVQIARVALAQSRGEGPTHPAGRTPAHVAVVATAEQIAALTGGPPAGLASCEQTGPITSPVLSRLTCDAILHRVLTAPSGAVLDVGRATRYATPAQRKALTVRDRSCLIPGCQTPVHLCDIHHVTSWSRGGASDLANLVPLCSSHHTAVHAGTWQVTVRDGLPWVVPPSWVDPARRALRDHLPQATRAAFELASELTALDQPGEGPGAQHGPTGPAQPRSQAPEPGSRAPRSPGPLDGSAPPPPEPEPP